MFSYISYIFSYHSCRCNVWLNKTYKNKENVLNNNTLKNMVVCKEKMAVF